jgi:hypothetical protein
MVRVERDGVVMEIDEMVISAAERNGWKVCKAEKAEAVKKEKTTKKK